ncbi:hypothetical protein C7M84_010244 [Penaeus vannamei]|uniref:Uncharacterized protein n=1 Tax=Penaeus vannamei TaxID=6689 RepID=A0A3R7M455_PENVA|nr:hypothetical protein C7M84_010244 [Penaeus vannamei]
MSDEEIASLVLDNGSGSCKLVSLVTTTRGLLCPPSWAGLGRTGPKGGCKTYMLVKKPKASVIFSSWNTPSNTASSPTGTTWKRSGPHLQRAPCHSRGTPCPAHRGSPQPQGQP